MFINSMPPIGANVINILVTENHYTIACLSILQSMI